MIAMSTPAPSPIRSALQYEPRRPTMRRTSAASIVVLLHRRHVAGLAVGGELEEGILEALALAPDLRHTDAGLEQRPVDRDQPLVADVGDLEVERLVLLVAADPGHERDAREHAARTFVVVGAQEHRVAAARDQLVDGPPRDQAAALHDRDVVGHLLPLVED